MERLTIFGAALAALVVAGPVVAAPPNASTTRAAAATADVPPPEASQLRIEEALSALADESARANRSGDVLWIAHVEAERARVDEPMALIDEELQIINDPKQTAQARLFATEKLAAAADLLEQIVQRARAYQGNQAPEDRDDETRTESLEPMTIPLEDPTSSVADYSVAVPPTSSWPSSLSAVL